MRAASRGTPSKAQPVISVWTLTRYGDTKGAVREMKEELDVDIDLVGLQGVYSFEDDPRAHMVLIVYRAVIRHDVEPHPGDDVDRAAFFAKDDLPSNIAFAGVRAAIDDYFRGATLAPLLHWPGKKATASL